MNFRALYAICLLSLTALGSGCALCCSPYDDCYNAYGSVLPRCNQCCGRVASVFDGAECGGMESSVEGAEIIESE